MTRARTFLFTSAQRVGSTAILNSFPEDLFYIGGPFRKELGRPHLYTHLPDIQSVLAQRDKNPQNFVDDVVVGYPRATHSNVVFKIEYRSFFGGNEPWRAALMAHLSGHRTIEVIHCYRANLLERFVSMMRMRKTGEVGVKTGEARIKAAPFRVKPKQAVANIARIIKQMNKVHAAFKTNAYHLIAYEELRDNWHGTLSALGEFTGTDLSTAQPIHQKLITNYQEVLENYDEVRAAVISEFGEQTALNFSFKL